MERVKSILKAVGIVHEDDDLDGYDDVDSSGADGEASDEDSEWDEPQRQYKDRQGRRAGSLSVAGSRQDGKLFVSNGRSCSVPAELDTPHLNVLKVDDREERRYYGEPFPSASRTFTPPS